VGQVTDLPPCLPTERPSSAKYDEALADKRMPHSKPYATVKKTMTRFALPLSLLCLAAASFAATLPRDAGDIAVTLTGGKQVKLSDYPGQVRVVAFILTTWPHCQKTTQVLSGIQKELGSKGLQIIEGTLNADPDIPGFLQRFQPNFPVGSIDPINAGAIMQLSPMVRTFVPYMLIVDRKGVIQAQYTGGDDFLKDEEKQEQNIRSEILKWLKQPAAKSAGNKKK
jgi:hypothetical protein